MPAGAEQWVRVRAQACGLAGASWPGGTASPSDQRSSTPTVSPEPRSHQPRTRCRVYDAEAHSDQPGEAVACRIGEATVHPGRRHPDHPCGKASGSARVTARRQQSRARSRPGTSVAESHGGRWKPQQDQRSVSSAISNLVIRVTREYTGRGPTQARTYMQDDLIAVVLRETLTKGERMLVENDHARPCPRDPPPLPGRDARRDRRRHPGAHRPARDRVHERQPLRSRPRGRAGACSSRAPRRRSRRPGAATRNDRSLPGPGIGGTLRAGHGSLGRGLPMTASGPGSGAVPGKVP